MFIFLFFTALVFLVYHVFYVFGCFLVIFWIFLRFFFARFYLVLLTKKGTIFYNSFAIYFFLINIAVVDEVTRNKSPRKVYGFASGI